MHRRPGARAADPRPSPSSILITGASSGIGAALALAYATPGAHMALGGRDEARLETVRAACAGRGATVSCGVVDVTDRAAMRAWIDACEGTRPLGLVIANAGISGRDGGGDGEGEPARRIFAVNLDGTLNTIGPALAHMRRRRRGQIALMSSLAAFRGMPSAPAYTASKAAVRIYGEALRPRLAGDGIAVSVICPGFVRTALTARNPFPMPLLMEPERAAAIIQRGLERRRARIAFPLRLYVAVRALAALPPSWPDRWLARLPAKE